MRSLLRRIQLSYIQRGIKRKPLLDTDLDSEPESESAEVKPSTAAASTVKKGVVYSDDEDDDGDVRMLGKRRPKRKSAVTSDSEISLRAMMDIDDGAFFRLPLFSRT